MVIWYILFFTDMLLWIILAVSVFYILFFALASLLPRNLRNQKSKLGLQTSDLRPQTLDLRTSDRRTSDRRTSDRRTSDRRTSDRRTSDRRALDRSTSDLSTFLVLYPAYNEDAVIRSSVETFLKQDYPRDHYQLVVISDHMTDETNAWLALQPITLLTPHFDKSSKAKALQHAVHELCTMNYELSSKNYVVILDADNVVAPDFLSHLNAECQKGYHAIQCHRTAKNADNNIAALDGLSEEINNSIFRRGHNRVGLSSALIGSGMCFDYQWFADNVDSLDSAVEDRELEALLMRQGIYIHYAEDILVMDEKVSNNDNFQRQRLRWMTGQVQALLRMTPYVPRAIATGNINYLDKTLQQALIPRSILLMVIPLMVVLIQCSMFIVHCSMFTIHSMKWWFLFLALIIALLIAIPRQLRTRTILSKVSAMPSLVLRMTCNLIHIKTDNTDFLHTEHGKK